MFRASLRSVSDPLREHVCFSCLAQRLGSRSSPRLYSTAASSAKSSDGSTEHSPVKGTKSQKKPSHSEKKPSPQPRKDAGSKKSNQDDGKKSKTVPAGPPSNKVGPPRITRKVSGIPALDRSQNQKKMTREKSQSIASKKLQQKVKGPVAQELKEMVPNRKSHQREPRSKDAVANSAVQASVQSIITQIQNGKPNVSGSKETPEDLSFVMSSIFPKETGSVDTSNLKLKALDVEKPDVPRLSFGLERVLFNPGVYHLRDPRSRVYNFDPYLGSIMPVSEFDFDALKAYITSSKDETLASIARAEKKKYIGSSSSMTSVLSHFHYLLSNWRGVDTRMMSQNFPDHMRSFTRLLRSPAAMFLRYQNGTYAIDADKEFDSANILMNLGKSMEKLLTLPKEDFERYRRSHENKISAEEEQAIPEAYHYSTMGDFLMRSQLDAYDPRLPGTGMFDLKTRAVVSIRMDARNFEHGLGYEIRHVQGGYESYEREYYDMIRAAFLKYSLQVRIGRMDGIFVAFHNIERIFGFQYVSLPEMDQALHGQTDTSLGDAEFRLSIGLWNKILDKVTAKFPKRSIRLHFETRDAQTPFMYIFAEPVTNDEIEYIQTKNQAEIDAYQRRILNLSPMDGNDDLDETPASPEKPAANPQPPAEQKAQPDAQADAQAAYDSSAPPDESFLAELEAEESDLFKGKEIMAMTLVVKNFVNGSLVDRPMVFRADDKWTVEYELSELQGNQVSRLYNACQTRREKALSGRGEDEADAASNVYIRRLRDLAMKGRAYRSKQDDFDSKHGTVVLNDDV